MCCAFNFSSFGVYGLCFTLNLYILEAFKQLPLFDPKSRNMTSLKRHLLKKFSTDFSEISMVNAKLVLKKVGIQSFVSISAAVLSYQENPTRGGGVRNLPPGLKSIKVVFQENVYRT